MEWVDSTIGEACDLGGGEVKTGPFGSQLHQSDYEDSGVPVVMPKDIIDGYVDEKSIARVSTAHVNRLSKHKLSEGDIVYGRRGDIGRQALVRNKNVGWLCGTGCLRITLGDAPIDPYFLHLYLRQPDVIKWISNQAIGATMPNLNTGILREIPIRFPKEIDYQRKLSKVISTYDDLIENNNRRIAILEEMAQSLYREWFVKFRFPGFENTKFIDSTLGKIPEGWEVRNLSAIADINSESITKKSTPERIEYIDISSVGTDSINETKGMLFSEAPSRARRIVRNGDIIWATVRPNRKQYAFISRPLENTVVSTGFAVLRSKEVPASFLYKAATTDEFTSYLVNHATGAAYPAVNASDFEKALFLVPNIGLLKLFDDAVLPILSQKEYLKRSNDNLKKQRDLLLPKLISGQIDVS